MPILPILPRLTGATLVGYRPLFNETIRFEINNGCFIVIGGNGLGKTTILQSIIYCLGGEADLNIEDQRANRWGRDYFEGRLNTPNSASVSVDFYLGESKVSVTRGFRAKGLLSFKLNDVSVVDNPRETDATFESFLKTNGGYRNTDDFRFIVHKLCYLPENRANLVWDVDAQVRLLMLLFSDIITEGEFRERREQLKRLDSRRRHINVAVNNTAKDLRTIYLYDPNESETTSQEALEAELASEEIPVNDTNYAHIISRLQELVKTRFEFQTKARDLRENIKTLANEIESVQEKLAREEEVFILQQLSSLESEETKLAIHKLLHLRQCPACGSEAQVLSDNAWSNVRDSKCPLCGTPQDTDSRHQIDVLDVELQALVHRRIR